MAKSLFDLNRELAGLHRRSGRHAATNPALPPPAPVQAAAASVRRGTALRTARARSFVVIDVTVDGPVPLVPQRTGTTCWAAAYAMMYGWKRRNTVSMDAALQAIANQRWAQKVNSPNPAEQGLGSSEAPDFAADAGLSMLPANLTIEGMAGYLQNYGPLMIILRMPGHTGGWTHARVITAIRGDGTPEGTFVYYNDPAGSREVRSSFKQNMEEYEAAARLVPVGQNINLAIFHWPAGARQMSVASNGGRAESLSVYRAAMFAAATGHPRDVLIAALVDQGIAQAAATRLVNDYEAALTRTSATAQSWLASSMMAPGFTVTIDQVRQMFPNGQEAYFTALEPILVSTLAQHEINTPLRVAHFMAQIGHETGSLRRLEENLDYSAQRLRQVWPSRFPDDATAQQYAHQPQRLANFVYASRLGNGDPASGDGWRYRGRGYIQLTGRANYRTYGAVAGTDVEANPDVVSDPGSGFVFSCAFWRGAGVNQLADTDNVEAVTRRVNGGVTGLAERQALTARAKTIWH
jgi:putative chitinase